MASNHAYASAFAPMPLSTSASTTPVFSHSNPSLLVVAFSVSSGQRTRSLHPHQRHVRPSCIHIPTTRACTRTFAKNNNADEESNSDPSPDAYTYRSTSDSHNEREYAFIEDYLGKSVTAVKLPEKYKYGPEYKKYPPLILDGASGVGKTQQAFALLKNGKERLVYVLMTPRSESNQQKIYKEMRKFTKMDWDLGIVDDQDVRSFLDLLDKAMEQAENEAAKGQDTFEDLFYGDRPEGYIARLEESLCRRVITYSHGGLEIKEPRSPESVRKFSLNDVVLFIDEALPPLRKDEKQDEADYNRNRDVVYNRLRFLRKFGRAVGMRTVFAGTAATAANINKWTIPPAPPSWTSYSRVEPDKDVWAEVEFLDPRIDHQIPLTEDATVQNVTVHTRPLLKTWLQRDGPSDSIQDAIRTIKAEIGNSKYFPDDSLVIWLSGACLDSLQRSSPPLRLKSSDLVRSHFFEPAISMDSEGRFIYLGKGIDDIKRRQGPLRLRLLRQTYFKGEKRKVAWALMVADNDHGFDNKATPLSAGVSHDFKDIAYGLSHCVQQCLAKEPLLAVALSDFSARFISDRPSIKRFHSAIAAAFPETKAHSAKGALDGKLNELVMFAALQLACRKYSYHSSTNTVRDFIIKLHDYLQVATNEERNFLLYLFSKDLRAHKREKMGSKIKPTYQRHAMKKKNNSGKSSNVGNDSAADKENNDDNNALNKDLNEFERYGGKLDDTKMPWLVPACSEQSLQETHAKNRHLFTKDLNIAGLVPGTDNSRMAAEAYTWGESLEKEWVFEFKSQANYSLDDGCKDLVQKCQVAEDVDSENEEEKDTTTIACHGMLIAMSGEHGSGCQWWVEEGQYLRVVLVVNNSPY